MIRAFAPSAATASDTTTTSGLGSGLGSGSQSENCSILDGRLLSINDYEERSEQMISRYLVAVVVSSGEKLTSYRICDLQIYSETMKSFFSLQKNPWSNLTILEQVCIKLENMNDVSKARESGLF